MSDREESDVSTPLPRLNRKKQAARVRLVEGILARLSDPLTVETVLAGAGQVHDALNAGTLGAVTDTLLLHCGPFGPPQRALLALQLASRVDELMRGPIAPFTKPTHDQWVPLEVTKVAYSDSRDHRVNAILSMRALSCQPAGYTLSRDFSPGYLRFLAYQIGFSRKLEYDEDIRHFIGLQFWLHLQRGAEDEPRLQFNAWQVSPWMLKHNRTIIKLRTRFVVDDSPECPHEHQHECWDCQECVSSCPASIKR